MRSWTCALVQFRSLKTMVIFSSPSPSSDDSQATMAVASTSSSAARSK